jgi:hypothetical protein
MNTPDWADKGLSQDLAVLRARGEGQDLEYMESFPTNTRELAKEIAAFASSNTGTILIGVSDSGDLIGIAECHDPAERDKLIRRLEGISRGTVKPAVIPTAKFAVENDKVVLVIVVPEGAQPVYYASNVPYVRHLTEARPAEPHEVLEKVQQFFARLTTTTEGSEGEKKGAFFSRIARSLVEVLVYADQFQERQVNPWLDMWRSDFSYVASELRELAAEQLAVDEQFSDDLVAIASSLDEAANMRLFIGGGDDLAGATHRAAEKSRAFLSTHLDVPVNDESLRQVKTTIDTSNRRLKDLVARAETMINSGRTEELQSEASCLGRDLARLSYYKIDAIGEGVRDSLRSIGVKLHLTETMRLYMDGGRSVQAVVDRISACSEQLDALARF